MPVLKDSIGAGVLFDRPETDWITNAPVYWVIANKAGGLYYTIWSIEIARTGTKAFSMSYGVGVSKAWRKIFA